MEKNHCRCERRRFGYEPVVAPKVGVTAMDIGMSTETKQEVMVQLQRLGLPRRDSTP